MNLDLENLSAEEIQKEIVRCAMDIKYWINRYVWIEDKEAGKAIPFKLYPSQERVLDEFIKEFENPDGIREFLTLKSRQTGFSWLWDAIALWCAITRPLFEVVIISRNGEKAVEELQRVHFMLDRLPKWMVPSIMKDNEGEIVFARETRKGGRRRIDGLQSKISSVATTSDSGRSVTANMVIVQEAAFIRDVGKMIEAAKPGLQRANGILSVVSTSDGAGGYMDRAWRRARRKDSRVAHFFISCHEVPGQDKEWFERHLKDSDEPEIFVQENPRTASDCFRSGTGGVFDAGGLQIIRESIRTPLDTGYVENASDGFGWVSHSNGNSSVWEFPIPGSEYAVGADVAEGKEIIERKLRDSSAIFVMNRVTGKQAFRFDSTTIPPDEFGSYAVDVASWYNNAILGIEANNTCGGSAISAAKARRYSRLYRDPEDPRGEPGWRTDNLTKSIMITDLAKLVKQGKSGIADDEVLDQLSTYVRDRKGKLTGRTGTHDDLVMAAAIAWQMHIRTALVSSRMPPPAPVEHFQKGVSGPRRSDRFVMRSDAHKRSLHIRYGMRVQA